MVAVHSGWLELCSRFLRWADYNTVAMADSRINDGVLGKACAATLFAAAPVVLALYAAPAGPVGRAKGCEADSLPTLTYAATVADDVTPAPMVTSPSDTVASFAVRELPLVASVVVIRCVDVVALARIGGLYGP